MDGEIGLKMKLTVEQIWATPSETVTIDQLEQELISLGYTIVETDKENNRIKIEQK